MKCMLSGKWLQAISGIVCMFLFVPSECAGHHKEHPYRYSILDMPVSLALGTVRTPEFPVTSKWYWILIQVEKPLPFQQMECMMGVTMGGPLDLQECSSNDPLLRADWTVWNGSRKVSSGSSTTVADAKFTDKHIFKFLGKFPGETGKKYVLEVKFTKNGSPLDVANPHLIIVKIGEE
jgi:hypothetical protein